MAKKLFKVIIGCNDLKSDENKKIIADIQQSVKSSKKIKTKMNTKIFGLSYEYANKKGSKEADIVNSIIQSLFNAKGSLFNAKGWGFGLLCEGKELSNHMLLAHIMQALD